MLVELALAITIVKTYNYLKSSHFHLKNDFKNIMNGIGIKNKLGQTFKVIKTIDTSYGYKVIINIPEGLSLKHLEDKANIIQDNLNALIEFNKNPFKENITMYLVNKDIFKYKFKPVQQDCNKLYIGKDVKQNPYFVDLNKNPMILICGVTGYGKTMLLSSIITNLIYNCSKDIELWFAQLIKGELYSFDNCVPVKFSAYDKESLGLVINKLRKKLDDRTELLKNNGIRNITQWNKHFKKRKMKRVILICEEASELMEVPELWGEIWSIVKAGRSVGIHFIACMQRITSTNINTNVRSQMLKITFHQNSESDSKMAIGNSKAMDLSIGECIVAIDGNKKIKVPFIDDDFKILNKYVHEIKTPSLKTINTEKPEVIHLSEGKKEHIGNKRKGVVSLEDIKNANRKR